MNKSNVNDDKTQMMFFLIILIIILIASAVLIPNFGYAYESFKLHKKTLYEISRYAPSEENPHIKVGETPSSISIDSGALGRSVNRIYVTNVGDNTVSVIDGENNSKMGDIKVGNGPHSILVNRFIPRIYVLNGDDNTVSVIDGDNYSKITNIKVGDMVSDIALDECNNKIFAGDYYYKTVSVFDGENNYSKIADIKVKNGILALGVDCNLNKLYVAETGYDAVSNTVTNPDTVSVFDGENNYSKIADIKVGRSSNAIAVDEGVYSYEHRAYVVDEVDHSIAVIDGENNSKIGNIKVGKRIVGITINPITHRIYVAHPDYDAVSVFDGWNYSKIGGDIKVGDAPGAIAVNYYTNTIYVANMRDNTVSVIDENASKVVAKIMFNIEPFNSGYIECDKEKLIAPRSQQFYVYSGVECTAKPNPGFEFISWQENLGGNSSQILQFPSPPSIWDSILEFSHLKPDKEAATLEITKFGSFTANFKELPPPIPPEYVATLLGVVATAFVGSWLTPSIIDWRKTKKQGSKLNHYHNEIKNLYNDGKLDSSDFEKLNKLRNNITDDYTKGRINKEQYDKLGSEISVSYREIFKKEIDSLNTLSENNKVKRLNKINDDISDAYAEEKINELHYNLLKEKITELENDNKKNGK